MKKVIFSFIVTALLSGSVHAMMPMKNIKIQNLHKAQILSPAVIVVHRADYKLFEIGQPASSAVIALAEEGVRDGFKALESSDDVFKVALFPEAVPPGKSKSMKVAVPTGYKISVLSMLVTTNDAFTGIQGESANGVYYANTYDSGSEANTESCAHVPGPPCGAHNVRVTNGAEGFVHMHNGVHGVADLASNLFDFRGAVAKIEIKSVD